MSAIPEKIDLSQKPEVTAFFEETTNTVSYCPAPLLCTGDLAVL